MNDDELRRAYAAWRTSPTDAANVHATPSLEEIEKLVAGDTPHDEREALLDRVLSDPAATRELAMLHAVAPPRAATTRWRRSPWTALAAAAAVLVIAGPLIVRARNAGDEQVFRATNNESGAVEIVEPAAVVAPVPGMRITWRSVPDVERYTLEMVSDDGAALATITTRDTTLVLPDSISAERLRAASGWMLVARLRDGGQRQSVMRMTTSRAP